MAKNILEQLKQNEKPFGLMSAEMQEKMIEIGKQNLDCFWPQNGGTWNAAYTTDEIYCGTDTYRLRPDYEEEPEIVECELYNKESQTRGCYIKAYDFGNKTGLGLAQYPDGYKRIGFKFKDGTVMGTPVKYSVPGMTSKGYYASYEDLKTSQALEHHAIAVLFRRPK